MDRIWNIGDRQILYSMVCRLRVARPLWQASVAIRTSAYRKRQEVAATRKAVSGSIIGICVSSKALSPLLFTGTCFMRDGSSTSFQAVGSPSCAARMWMNTLVAWGRIRGCSRSSSGRSLMLYGICMTSWGQNGPRTSTGESGGILAEILEEQ